MGSGATPHGSRAEMSGMACFLLGLIHSQHQVLGITGKRMLKSLVFRGSLKQFEHDQLRLP